MIYRTVNEQDFVRAFDEMGRSENFSRMARRVLFEYFESLSDDLGQDIELDPIAICCDWGEYTERELLEHFGDQKAPSDPEKCEEEAAELAEELARDGTLLVVEHIEESNTYLYRE